MEKLIMLGVMIALGAWTAGAASVLPYGTYLVKGTFVGDYNTVLREDASAAVIRRHSTLRAGADFKSTRLVGRSAWNDRWIIVIPASAIDADREKAMDLIESGVKDVKLGIRAYAQPL